MEFKNLTDEELCDLMCGGIERELVDGFSYAVGDLVLMVEKLNDSWYAEIVELGDNPNCPTYRVCQEYPDCDDVIYSWVYEEEIEQRVREV